MLVLCLVFTVWSKYTADVHCSVSTWVSRWRGFRFSLPVSYGLPRGHRCFGHGGKPESACSGSSNIEAVDQLPGEAGSASLSPRPHSRLVGLQLGFVRCLPALADDRGFVHSQAWVRKGFITCLHDRLGRETSGLLAGLVCSMCFLGVHPEGYPVFGDI